MESFPLLPFRMTSCARAGREGAADKQSEERANRACADCRWSGQEAIQSVALPSRREQIERVEASLFSFTSIISTTTPGPLGNKRFILLLFYKFSPKNMSVGSDFGNPLRKFKLVFLGEQSGKSFRIVGRSSVPVGDDIKLTVCTCLVFTVIR